MTQQCPIHTFKRRKKWGNKSCLSIINESQKYLCKAPLKLGIRKGIWCYLTQKKHIFHSLYPAFYWVIWYQNQVSISVLLYDITGLNFSRAVRAKLLHWNSGPYFINESNGDSDPRQERELFRSWGVKQVGLNAGVLMDFSWLSKYQNPYMAHEWFLGGHPLYLSVGNTGSEWTNNKSYRISHHQHPSLN